MKLPKMYYLACRQMPWKDAVVEERFQSAGIQVERFEGVHGATIGIAPILTVHDAPCEHPYRESPGKTSITITKLLMWQRILDRADDPVLVLENDVTFCQDFTTKLPEAIERLPADWDVCHVGHCCVEDKPTVRINDRISEIRHPFCCHAILWTKRAAAIASDEFRKASWGTPSDVLLAKVVYPKLRHYSCTPPLAYQDRTQSEAASTGRWDGIQGWFDFARIYDEALDRVQKSGRPAVFVEVGCWKGRSTAYLAEEIKRRLLPVEFWAVDTWKGMPFASLDQVVKDEFGGDLFPTFQRNMSRAGVIDYIRPLQMTSVEAAARFPDRSLDFVFVDGDHTYEAVIADLRAWLPKLRPDGVIAGHDYGMEGVRQAVSEILPGRFRTWESCWISDHP